MTVPQPQTSVPVVSPPAMPHVPVVTPPAQLQQPPTPQPAAAGGGGQSVTAATQVISAIASVPQPDAAARALQTGSSLSSTSTRSAPAPGGRTPAHRLDRPRVHRHRSSLASAQLASTGGVPIARAAAVRPWAPIRVFETSSRRGKQPAGLAALSSWSIGGLFFSLGPQLSEQLFTTTNVIIGAVGGVLLGFAGALSQLVFRHTPNWLGAAAGSGGLAVGMLLVVIAAAANSSAVFVLGMMVAGFGFGLAFLGGLRQLNAVIPPEHRAAVMSAFYVVAYASLSLPAIVAGFVVTHLGLDMTFETFGSVVAGIALIAAIETWRTRPSRPAAEPNRRRDCEPALLA